MGISVNSEAENQSSRPEPQQQTTAAAAAAISMKVLAARVAVLLLVGVVQASGDFDCQTANCHDIGAGTFACPDCSGYVTCQEMASGGPYIQSYTVCGAGSMYDPESKSCSSAVSSCTHSDTGHLDHEHSCDCNKVGTGLYPCPHCDGFHKCTPAADGGFIDDYTECSAGTWYDFSTNKCEPGPARTDAQLAACKAASAHPDDDDEDHDDH